MINLQEILKEKRNELKALRDTLFASGDLKTSESCNTDCVKKKNTYTCDELDDTVVNPNILKPDECTNYKPDYLLLVMILLGILFIIFCMLLLRCCCFYKKQKTISLPVVQEPNVPQQSTVTYNYYPTSPYPYDTPNPQTQAPSYNNYNRYKYQNRY